MGAKNDVALGKAMALVKETPFVDEPHRPVTARAEH
jgi:hypothetical protein